MLAMEKLHSIRDDCRGQVHGFQGGDFWFFRFLPRFYVQALFSTRRATRQRSIIAPSLVPSVVPTRVVAQARVNLLTAIHELKVTQMLFVLQPSLSMEFFGTADQEPPPWQKPEEPDFFGAVGRILAGATRG
jgi:hypothetical protein